MRKKSQSKAQVSAITTNTSSLSSPSSSSLLSDKEDIIINTKMENATEGLSSNCFNYLGSIAGIGSYTQNTHVKNTNNQPNDYEKSPNTKADIRNSATQNDHKDVIALEQPLLPSEPSANEVAEQQIPDSIYRIGRSDLFACKNCKIKGDKPFMMKHPQYCKGSQEGQSKQIWR
jgi:hypothetical protein